MVMFLLFALVKGEKESRIVGKSANRERLEKALNRSSGVGNVEVRIDVEVKEQLIEVEGQQVELSVVHVGNGEGVSVGRLLDLVRFDELAFDVDLHQFLVAVDFVLNYFVVRVCHFHQTNRSLRLSRYYYCHH